MGNSDEAEYPHDAATALHDWVLPLAAIIAFHHHAVHLVSLSSSLLLYRGRLVGVAWDVG